MSYKVLETETHIYFLTGPLSQWHPSKFRANFAAYEPEYDFSCAEQYMMAGKAELFGDTETFDAIMKAKHPREQKRLGRLVKNFDPNRWNEKAQDLVFRGQWFRSLIDDEYRSVLISSGSKVLVEGNKNDPIWAVGLDWDDPAILDEANWKGTNWLGKVHMRVRETIPDDQR